MVSKQNKNSTGAVASNKKARFEYEIVDKIEAGISLNGSEVKSLRAGNADLNGSYARIINGECYLYSSKIDQYFEASYNNHDPQRQRKLLLHKAEIRKLYTKLDQRGYTLVPLKIYFNSRGIAKVQLALASGKKKYDKRNTIKERDNRRDTERQMRNFGR
nr:SsrA-binding protein SmpB [Limihaloglobus sulfuriphilus]